MAVELRPMLRRARPVVKVLGGNLIFVWWSAVVYGVVGAMRAYSTLKHIGLGPKRGPLMSACQLALMLCPYLLQSVHIDGAPVVNMVVGIRKLRRGLQWLMGYWVSWELASGAIITQ